MAFDWPRFLRQQHIEFVTRGPNTARDHVSVKCPFCGDADPSQHMGISLKGHGWACWRNQQHRGKSRARLIQALLRCSEERARQLAGYEQSEVTVQDEDVTARLRQLLGGREAAEESGPLKLPREFKPMDSGSPLAQPFWSYMRGRGYNNGQIERLTRDYDLHYATRGRFGYRIILPVRNRTGELLNWTGRSIMPDEELRYDTLPTWRQGAEPDRTYGKLSVKQLLLGLPLLWRVTAPRALLICEGPFDALRITTFGASLGVYGTCLFGLTMSDAQVALIEQLAERYPVIGVTVDAGAALQGLSLAGRTVTVRPIQMPRDVKDPGELSAQGVVELCWKVLDLS